jgi:hypothetical protein
MIVDAARTARLNLEFAFQRSHGKMWNDGR